LDFYVPLFYSAAMSAFSYDNHDFAQIPVQTTPIDELRSRAQKLQTLMRQADVQGVMATQNADVFYLSGVVQQAQVYLPVEGQPLIMVRKHHGRARMVSQLGETAVVAVRSLRELPGLIEQAGGGNRPTRIGFELDTLPVATFNAYTKALAGLGAELVDASMLFRQARAIKSDYEIAQIKHAAQVAEAIVTAAAEYIREGIPDIALAALPDAA